MTILAATAAGSLGAILLIWIGYPIALWGLALVIRRPIRPDYERARSRRVSVVLATRENAATIEARVSNLLDTEHPSVLIEVIVALDAEGARATRQSLGHLDPRVHAVAGDAPGGKAATLNAGVRAAAGDVLIMADSAQRFDRRTIPELVACLEDERFGAVSGALSLGDRGGRSPVHAYWRMEKWLRYNESLLHSSIGVTGAVYATRRTTWPVIPPGTLLDDVFVPMSLVLSGHRVGFTYAATAADVRTVDAATEGDRKTRTLTGVIQLLHLLPGVANPLRNVAALQFFWHKLARLATPALAMIAVVSSGFLVVATIASMPPRVQLGMLMVALALASIRRVRLLVGSLGRWTFSMQRAMWNAIVNGLTQKWTVWTSSR